MKARKPIFQPAVPGDLSVEPFIDKQDVARRLRRTVRAVEKMVQKRQIPHYKYDFRVSFRWSEIQAHLARTCRIAAANEIADQPIANSHVAAVSPKEGNGKQ